MDYFYECNRCSFIAFLGVTMLILNLLTFLRLPVSSRPMVNDTIFNYLNFDCKCKSMFTLGACGLHSIPNGINDGSWYKLFRRLSSARQFDEEYPLLSDVFDEFTRLLESSYRANSTFSLFNWKKVVPDTPLAQGCKTHSYTPVDIKICTEKLHIARGTPLKIAFVGDSLTRSLMQWMLNYLTYELQLKYGDTNKLIELDKNFLDDMKTYNVPIIGDNLQLRLYWAPYLEKNRSKNYNRIQGARDLLVNWAMGNGTEEDGQIPDVIISGGGMWNNVFDYNELHSIEDHFFRINDLKPFYEILSRGSLILWQGQASVKEWAIRKKPKIIPIGALDYFNMISYQYLTTGKITFWDTFAVSAIKERHECQTLKLLNILNNIPESWKCSDPIHFGDASRKVSTNYIWNAVCNRIMKFNGDFCCS